MHGRNLIRLLVVAEVMAAIALRPGCSQTAPAELATASAGNGATPAEIATIAAEEMGGTIAEIDTITAEDMGSTIAANEGPRAGLGTTAEKAKLNEVAGYIHNRFAAAGLSVHEDPVTYGGATFPNVVGTLTGTVCPDRTFIVGAHYDGVSGSPAADDNASGTAATLEIARALSGQSFQPSIDFVAFSFEENGLVGSRQMAAEAQAADRALVGMLSLDSIGYTCDTPGCQTYPPGTPPEAPNVGNFILVVGNTASASLLDTLAGAAVSTVPTLPLLPLEVPGNGETGPDVRGSDHAPFWDQGYQALMVTDTPNLRNPNYHRSSDTLSTLDLGFAADVANAAAAAVVASVTADFDADSVVDACDSCPMSANGDQLDSDGDSLGNVCDNCPNITNTDQLNTPLGPIDNGPDIAGDDTTNPYEDAVGDACDDDADNDGLPDTQESDSACPFRLVRDSDGDGSLDGYEMAHSSDPCDPTSKPPLGPVTDSDGDGISDDVEAQGWGTDPYLRDSDGDACEDWIEIASVNADKQGNILDVLWVAKMAFGITPPHPALDLNKDGVVNILDIQIEAKNSTLVRPHAPCP